MKHSKLVMPAFAAVLTLFSTMIGCGDKASSSSASATPASSGAPASASSSAAAASDGKCQPDEFAGPDNVFCVKLPAGYKAQPTTVIDGDPKENRINFDVADPSSFSMGAMWKESGQVDQIARYGAVAADTTNKLESDGAAPKGDGKWRVYTSDNGWQHCETFFLHGKKTYVNLSFAAFGGTKKLSPEILTICKTAYSP